jgi:hypothetical protein
MGLHRKAVLRGQALGANGDRADEQAGIAQDARDDLGGVSVHVLPRVEHWQRAEAVTVLGRHSGEIKRKMGLE